MSTETFAAPLTAAALLDGAAARLRAAGIPSPRLEARLLLAHALGAPADSLVVAPVTHAPDDETCARYDALVARRVAREPMAYVLGRKEFWSLEFLVGPGVLVPRPETETLIEQALLAFPNADRTLRALDLGTGSGCLLLAFLRERPNTVGAGIDASDAALGYARLNAKRLELADRVAFAQRDWKGLNGAFDVIFANPPYLAEADYALAPAELEFEPREALLGGWDGLAAYRAMAPVAAATLQANGRAFVEIGRGQVGAVEGIFSSAGLETISVASDLSGIPRCLVLANCPLGQKSVGKSKESG